jgi:hypothetical protein
LSGVVVSDSGSPLAGADVTLSSTTHGVGQIVKTDGTGSFTFGSVMPGRYALSARLEGFVAMEYGATRPDRAGMVVLVDDTQHVAALTIVLPRVATIRGVVTKPDGAPAHLVRVTAVRATRAGASAATWGSTATNASGEYSLGGLPPGPYYVRAFIPYQALSSGEMPLRGVFHPDAHDEADAATVTLAAGEDRIGIDVRLQEARPHQRIEES